MDFTEKGIQVLRELFDAFGIFTLEHGSFLGYENDVAGQFRNMLSTDVVEHPTKKIPVHAGFGNLPGQNKGKSRIIKATLSDVRHEQRRKERFFIT